MEDSVLNILIWIKDLRRQGISDNRSHIRHIIRHLY